MTKVWGRIGSGIMFRYQGKILLQMRGESVIQSGVWGIPGGALKGTEGMYHSEDLPEPELNQELIEELFASALTEVKEEVFRNHQIYNTDDINEFMDFMGITSDQIQRSIQNKIINFPYKDNFMYVTFIIDLKDDQFNLLQEVIDEQRNRINEANEETDIDWETGREGHEWHDKIPENVHSGLKTVMENLGYQ